MLELSDATSEYQPTHLPDVDTRPGHTQRPVIRTRPQRRRVHERRHRGAAATWLLVSGAAAVVMSSCGGAPAGSAATSTPTATPTSVLSVSGHSGGSGGGTVPATSVAATSGSATLAVTFASRRRTVVVQVPGSYTGSSKVALVLNMHGSGSTAAGQEELSGMDDTSDRDGFIVAYPQGLIPNGSGYDWNVPGVPLIGGRAVPAGAADDVRFLTSLVGILEQRYCIDNMRVYATGFSGGARTASQLACDAPSTFAAVAPVSGLRHPTPCPATRPVPVLAFHGTADLVDPYGGHGEAYWTYSGPPAAQDWGVPDRRS